VKGSIGVPLRSGGLKIPRRTPGTLWGRKPHGRNSPFLGTGGVDGGQLDATEDTQAEIWQLQSWYTSSLVPVVGFSGLRSSRGLGYVVQPTGRTTVGGRWYVHQHLKLICILHRESPLLVSEIWWSAAFSKERWRWDEQPLQITSADRGIRISRITS
jgi:hypothetical protein